MSKKTLALGLALSGLMGTAPAWAQSALAQQAADQEKAAQQGTATSSTNAGTAKPAAAKPATTAASTSTATKSAATKPAATAPTASAATTKSATPKSAALKPAAVKKAPPKPIVYVDDGVNGGATATASGADSKTGKPQNREVVKALEQSCPDVTVTEQKAKAGYDVTLEREPGSKGVKTVFGLANVVHKTNKIEVTSKSGKEVFSESGHSTNQLVKDACAAIATPPTKVAKN
jgi:hypothetical protein